MDSNDKIQEETEVLPLSKAVEYLLEECRMVLPGIQALFGFQLIAVFNEGFSEKLSTGEQYLHILAITFIALAIALIMSPAAYHRQVGRRKATNRFILISTRLLLLSMIPLSLGICMDFYLVANIVLDSSIVLPVTLLLFAVFMVLWFVFPRMASLQRLLLKE
jgi:hypothetical protein